MAVEAVDRAMRGEGSPSPIYEGEDSTVAWVLDGRTEGERKGRDKVVEREYYYQVGT